jgi:hypothetical protein
VIEIGKYKLGKGGRWKEDLCGDAIENNIFHYFYVCPLFIRHRIQLFNSLRKFQDV